MKKILLLFFLTFLIFGCRGDDYGKYMQCKDTIFTDLRVPLYFDSVNYYFITSSFYPKESGDGLPLSTLIKYNTINDSLSIKKLEIVGVPLVFHKNDFDNILLVTSKCVYSLDSNNNIKLEVNYNTQNNLEIIGKTIYDYKDDKIFIRPGIDNPNHEIYEINHNSFSSNILNNKLSEIKFTLVDFNIIKNNNNIDYIFTDGISYSLVKDELVTNKKLSTQDKIYSICYNNIDNEICLGTTNDNIYYDNFNQVRVNNLKNGKYFPENDCPNDIITDINIFKDILIIQKNNSSFDDEIVLMKNSYLNIKFGAISVKSPKFNSIITKKNGNTEEYIGSALVSLGDNNMLNLFIDGHFYLNYPFVFNTLIVNFSKKTIYIRKNNNTEIKKSFEY